jgi:hypothetical protein
MTIPVWLAAKCDVLETMRVSAPRNGGAKAQESNG